MKYLKLFEAYQKNNTLLFCSGLRLVNFPKKYLPLPYTLLELYCFNNKFKKLPDLPDSLIKLSCDNNQLTELPELPDSIEELYCSHNQITYISKLPKSLRRLSCYNNKIKTLPDLPENLKELWIDYYLCNDVPLNFYWCGAQIRLANKNNLYHHTRKEVREYIDHRISVNMSEYKYIPDTYKDKEFKKKYSELEKMNEFDLL